MSASGPISERTFTEGFIDPDEPAPWWLLNFYLELPFYFPYLDGAKFNTYLHREKWAESAAANLPEPPFVLLAAIQTSVPAPIEPSPAMAITMRNLLHDRAKGDLRTAFDVIPVETGMQIASIVEAITPKVLLQSEVDAGLPHHPTTYLNRCLNALNVWIRSFAFLTLDTSVRTVQAENLPQFMAFFHQRPYDGEIIRFDFFRAHDNPIRSRNAFATRSLAEKTRSVASSVDDTHGVFKSKEWFHTAVRLSTVEGRHDLAIVAINTAFELLVFGLARVLLADEGRSSQDIEVEFGGRMGVGTLCHRYIEPRIGGRWDTGDQSCPIGDVTATIVEVRNKVAHQGLPVSPGQVSAGLTSFINFAAFMVRRTAASRWRYPRACMDLINTYQHPPDVTVGARFNKTAQAIVKATPKYWLPPDDPRQSSMPHVVVQGTTGDLPGTISSEKRTHWETTNEFFMHWVVRPGGSAQQDAADGRGGSPPQD
ncbi:MAG: hypothetical protein E6J20_03980 [Chloroflexi bacterium]|nr:MAG: hypothetical protein E6J20_03980 [Chloroflexota bacterium]